MSINNINRRSSTTSDNNIVMTSSTINIAVMGDPKTGKTSLIECFLNSKFEEKSTDTILNISKTKIIVQNFNIHINILYYLMTYIVI